MRHGGFANTDLIRSKGVAMSKTAPHYFLLTEFDYDPAQTEKGGRWRFVLESMNSDDRVEVSERCLLYTSPSPRDRG